MKTLLFIHGMWSNADIWSPFADWFEGRGYGVVHVTLRHHDVAPGDPPPPELANTSFADYLDDLRKEIGVLPEPPVIIGHSMGGALAQALVADGLAEAGVFLCPAPVAGSQAVREVLSPSVGYTLMPWLLRWLLFGSATKLSFHRARFSSMNLLDRETARQEYANWIHESGRVLFELGLWFLDPRKATRVELSAIDVPVLTIAAGKDRIVPPFSVRETAKKLGRVGGDYIEYGNRSHWIIREPGWEEVAADIEAWLRLKVTAGESLDDETG